MEIEKLIIKKLLRNKVKTLEGLAVIKRKIAKRYKISCPSNVELLKAYHNLVKNKGLKKNEILEELLRKRKIRSLSGVVVVSVLTKSYPCPGKCIYCPQEKGLPKSYLSGEPAVERAKRNKFNPYLQVIDRIRSLEIQGHPTDKIELRIIGGSWTAYPKKYQSWFITRCFAACNAEQRENERKTTRKIKSLEKEQKKNEKAKHRIVGISIETRPDLINEKEILNLRKLGITMVELGVQTTYDNILEKCQRGHSVKETIKATKLLKETGFKIMYQIMPNLPGSNPKKDFSSLKEIFQNPDFKPDWLKIYPCVVCKNTKLYQLWKQGKYKSYSDKQLINLLIQIKEILPYWVRTARLFRDIPAYHIESGSKISNLRQVVQKEMKKRGSTCHCIRCREVKEKYNPKEKIYLFSQDYEASNSKEIFLSFENKNRTKLYSLLRLRIPLQSSTETRPRAPRPGVGSRYSILALKNSAIIRELHTYGQMIPIYRGSTSIDLMAAQHKGLGKKLIREAEKITKEKFKLSKITVISGIGVRDFFRKAGYKLKDTYMVKFL
ncbi:tRNA uridine(34) 5-carboxymethylaminomethyl modification radical SAM/GNAT enzyme Elp3 [Candidatus Parcubacteria bacterium]|nr:tRNA uridine(34) 5-carboxymethylaminomethyl modification radical SAM/GNAT enzyme Elp3 [Candidatus Parcubacteria bacterium]